MELVTFPVFKGFNCFAAWPRGGNDQKVKRTMICKCFYFIPFLKASSLFRILHTSPINSLQQIGTKTVPYYPGHYYVALSGPAETEVNLC